MKNKEMSYSKLVNLIETNNSRYSRFDVVSYLIGYKGTVNENDWNNIRRLYLDGFIDE